MDLVSSMRQSSKSVQVIWYGYLVGEYPDLRLARVAFIDTLNVGEKVIADDGYRDPNIFVTRRYNPEIRHEIKQILARSILD